MEDLIGSPAFLVAQFTPPVPRPSGEAAGQGGTHGLDMTAIDNTFTTLLRVRDLVCQSVYTSSPCATTCQGWPSRFQVQYPGRGIGPARLSLHR